MTTIQTKDDDGTVVQYPVCPPTPKKGYTIRKVDAIPAGPGKLLWQDNALVRFVAPPSPVDQARAAAAAAFSALSLGKQALWESVRAAVDAALKAGDAAKAVNILETVPVIYDGAEADRTAFLALFGVTQTPAPAPAN